MKKIVMLCSALVLGVWPEAQASLWEIEAYTNEKEIGVTSKTSLVAITERMNKLNSVSTVDAKRMYRWLYDYWLSDPKKWSNDGKKSTFGNIQGYVNQDYLVAYEADIYGYEKDEKDQNIIKEPIYDWTNNFNLMLKKIENLLPEAAANSGDEEIEKKKTQEEIDEEAAVAAAQAIHAENLKTDYGNKVTWDYTFDTKTFQPDGHDGYIETDKNGNPILTYEAQKRIESELLAQKHKAEVASRTEVQTQELAIDAADRLRESQKIQRNKLEEAVNIMEGTLYDTSPNINSLAVFDLTPLAELWGKEDIGVDVDEDFFVSLKRAWSMQALNMSSAVRLDSYGSYEISSEEKSEGGGDSETVGTAAVGENDFYVPDGYKMNKTTFLLPSEEKYDPNSFENGDGAGHAAIFLLNHFRDTDTLKTKPSNAEESWTGGTWDFRLVKGAGDTSKGDDGADLLQKLFNKFADEKAKETFPSDLTKITEEKMKFHLNLVARLLSEMAKEKDLVIKKKDQTPLVEEYQVDGIVFHSFRQYMLQAFREAIFLIKKSEDPAIAAENSATDPNDSSNP